MSGPPNDGLAKTVRIKISNSVVDLAKDKFSLDCGVGIVCFAEELFIGQFRSLAWSIACG